MAEYQDKLLDHDADGILEYDNPMPGWLMAILWGAMVFSVLYIAFYALAFSPDSYEAQLRETTIGHRASLQAYFDENPLVPPSAEELLAGVNDPEVVELGRSRFVKNCASCHGALAQGLIGPNLTDEYWLHGGKVAQVFQVVVKGVAAKGMPPWGRAIAPEEIAALTSYIRSIQGSNPPDAKQAEGERFEAEPVPGATPEPTE
jgi:cytochrome c oxidase cbb3-type subunit 3